MSTNVFEPNECSRALLALKQAILISVSMRGGIDKISKTMVKPQQKLQNTGEIVSLGGVLTLAPIKHCGRGRMEGEVD